MRSANLRPPTTHRFRDADAESMHSKRPITANLSIGDQAGRSYALSTACAAAAAAAGERAYGAFRTSHQPPEVCLFINKRERYSTALGAVCITNLKEANLEALLTGMEYKIQ
ncbi:hypothetical protein ACJJTC_002560 [Scirpophaga incertulas]